MSTLARSSTSSVPSAQAQSATRATGWRASAEPTRASASRIGSAAPITTGRHIARTAGSAAARAMISGPTPAGSPIVTPSTGRVTPASFDRCSQARLAFGCRSHAWDHRLASPSAAARTPGITGSPRLRLRLARLASQARLAFGCGSHGHDLAGAGDALGSHEGDEQVGGAEAAGLGEERDRLLAAGYAQVAEGQES